MTVLHDRIASPAVDPAATAASEWPVWSTTARVVVTEPGALGEATELVRHQLAAVGKACSRFRKNTELGRVQRAAGQTVRVSPLLAGLVAAALTAARESDGDVDPTLGHALAALGYDRDIRRISAAGGGVTVVRAAPGWGSVVLDGRDLTIPAGVVLDLGATAKAFTADRCAALVAERCRTGVLVSLGGDIATAGPAPEGGWRVRVQDRPGDPACTVALPAGAALATSSTVSRSWRLGGRAVHHILDPRTCQPAVPVWRSVSVSAYSCLEANTLTTASLVRGERAPGWLVERGVSARFVTPGRTVITLGGWPGERS
jgi:thiamine biosynthesis lipoprotein